MGYQFNDAFTIFKDIEALYAPGTTNFNEAQTRFKIIDEIVKKCLNWENNGIDVEIRNDAGFADYCLGAPVKCILEAKREGVYFELPIVDSKPDQVIDIRSVIKGNKDLEAALIQVQSYCAAHGVPIGIVSNGHQFIGFLATRLDGTPPLSGKCLAFRSLNQIGENFTLFWNFFSFDGVMSNNLATRLLSIETPPPSKLSKGIAGYPKPRESEDIQTTLRQLSELVLQDIIESSELEEEFFKECYCVSGPLTQFSLLSKNILQARYDSLFLDDGNRPTPIPVNKKKAGKHDFEHEVIAEATAKRPIVLIGDVGVGKTSFIKNLIYNEASDHFKNSIYVYIDLGSKATFADDFRKFVLNEIGGKLNDIVKGGINNLDFLKSLYKTEILDFESGANGLLKDIDPPEYQRRFVDFLLGKVNDQGSHLKEAIKFISKRNRCDVIVFIDNADQRDFDTQQNAFLVAQEIASNWKALAFVAVRPSTFFRSRRAGALSAYPHKVFTISPPKLEDALIKRLTFALSIVSGKRQIEAIRNISINISSLAAFINVVINSLKRNDDLLELITNVTGGNVRESIGLIVKYIGSPNVDAFNILKQLDEGNDYIIPDHEMSRAILLGDFEQFNPESSIAMNVFDTDFGDPKGHFLVLAILAILQDGDEIKDVNGYVSSLNLTKELQEKAGYTEKQISSAVKRCINKKLVEEARRITIEESSLMDKSGTLPSSVRITSAGAYHLVKWSCSFSYMEAVSTDTPIFDDETREKIGGALGKRLMDRFSRAVALRNYLVSQWGRFPALSGLISFEELIKNNGGTFSGVEKALIKAGRM